MFESRHNATLAERYRLDPLHSAQLLDDFI
jgi:hypothetical protein